MRIFAQPMLAIAFGAFILCAETCDHIDAILHPSHWYDLPLYDWSAGVFLIGAGLIGRRDPANGQPYQAAAWGFMVSLLASAFLTHWEEWSRQPTTDGWVSAGAFVGIIAAVLMIGLCGLVGTLVTRR
jgi:hypothetical protein